MDSEGRESLLNLKAIIDKNIEDATKEQTRVPFAVSQRMIQIFINRWKMVSRSLDIVANPYNPHGSTVYNADADPEVRKRKADLVMTLILSVRSGTQVHTSTVSNNTWLVTRVNTVEREMGKTEVKIIFCFL